MTFGRPCGKTSSGRVSLLLFHCQGSGMELPAAARARPYMVSVWRTTTKVWTASNCGVSGWVT